ncbi:MAG: NAD(+) synthase [Bacteroidetes bacterium]|nr:NAD(+) synthase [Bacteroidota bacterium]
MENKVKKKFSKDILVIEDLESVINKLVHKMKQDITIHMKRQGAVLGISGGVDSSVTLALAVKALGPERVLGLMMPEKESNSDSLRLGKELAAQFGIQSLVETVSGSLEGFGSYQRRDEAIKRVFPFFDPVTYKSKIGINQSGLNSSLPPVFYLTIVAPDGTESRKMIPVREYLQIVAASNFKQRSRMCMLYYHAEVNNYAVIGTANKHEIEQGFFVKHGDGGVDSLPIGNLYKTQVYQFAEYLGIPREIIERTPTSDTYSAEQTQEEFFFQLPFYEMDLAWYGFEHDYDAAEVAEVMGKTELEIKYIFHNFKRKQRTTEYLRMAPIRYEEI